MSARDDHPVLAAAEERLPTRGEVRRLLARNLTSVLDEIDDLRGARGAVARIEQLRDRARAAEEDADQLARTLREVRTHANNNQITNALDRHLGALSARFA